MKRLMYFAISVVLASICQAQSVAASPDVSIIDRTAGLYSTRITIVGEYWVAGRPGGRYAIEIHNRLGERLLAVTSVDGVNIVSGETAAWIKAATCSARRPLSDHGLAQNPTRKWPPLPSPTSRTLMRRAPGGRERRRHRRGGLRERQPTTVDQR